MQRKGIETSIELVRRLDDPRVKLVVSHAAGDAGDADAQRIMDFAALLGAELILVTQSYDIGLRYFSYRRVTEEMTALLSAPHLVSHGLDPGRCFAET